MKKKIIFLDIDGVLNSQRFYESVDKNLRIESHDQYGDMFDPVSSKLLNELIDSTGAKIVVSSTWRHQGFEKMKNMWIDRGMSGEVIGVTPSFRAAFTNDKLLERYNDVTIPRGLEIQWYYESKHKFRHWNWDGPYVQLWKEECDLETYVIIDDDSDMLYEQRNNFVHCKNEMGFTEQEFMKALAILTTPIV